MNRDTKHEEIIIVTRTGSITYPNLSVNEALALNEGYYEERYILAKKNGDFKVVWNHEDELFEKMSLDGYLRLKKIGFSKHFGIESYNLHEGFSQIGGDAQRHTGNNTFIISLDNGEEITIWEEVKDGRKQYSTQSEYIDIEDKLKRFTHTFSSMKALFGYIDKMVEGKGGSSEWEREY